MLSKPWYAEKASTTKTAILAAVLYEKDADRALGSKAPNCAASRKMLQ